MPPTTYQYITLAQAEQQLANRLYDSAMTFWTAAELAAYLTESLRTWNALTNYWRGDFTFLVQQGVVWYDLTDATNLPNTLRPYTVTDADLYSLMLLHLLEPNVTGINPYNGSLQFSAADFLAAVQRRRDEVLSVTGCTLTRRLIGAAAGRTYLPDTVIDVRRMAYLPNSPGMFNVVWADDTWSEQAFDPEYTVNPPGNPLTYLMSTEPPISVDTDAPPAFAGNYEFLTVEAGAALSATTPSTLLIPDDWTWVIKWGAMADLLGRESPAKDSPRAQYCEARYQMGLKLMASASALLALRVGNVPVQIDAVRGADLYNTSWEGRVQAAPDMCVHAGLNLIGINPPDSGTYSLAATVVENAPIPASGGAFLQVSRGDLDAIIDYAQHLASFKLGGAEFTSTMPLLQRFLAQAKNYGLKLDELGEFTETLYGLSQRENQMNPVMAPEPAGGGSA